MNDVEYEEGASVECVGGVEYFHENPHGDVDGIYLADGSEIRFPPHLGSDLFEALPFGQVIQVNATVHITKHDDVHLHAHKVVNVETGEVLLEKEPHVHKPKGPKHRVDNAEVLNELKAIRKLLEGRLATSE